MQLPAHAAIRCAPRPHGTGRPGAAHVHVADGRAPSLQSSARRDDTDVPVGYATAHGSTRSIAERAAGALCRAGLGAEARPMAEVRDGAAYDTFVLGSAVHRQNRLAPARAFVRDNTELLGVRPVWLFSVGMPAALRGPWRRPAPREIPVIEAHLPVASTCRGHRLFSGSSLRAGCPASTVLCAGWPGGCFGDYRDGDAADEGAARTARELRTRE
ncbi:flavodoxin domain-containing protein [Streptomyces sp. NPDC004783]|uniref:flavodoxin domain-containing protein n=1 Tax=Streptomyces sp. NPDC004783 TaxID=3154459 RepID=UPI0033B32898